MYCAQNGQFKTCFYIRNNVIDYYRKSVYNVELFILDTTSVTYKPIQFRKLDIKINEENTLLLKTDKGKHYVVVRHVGDDSECKCILIIDAQNGMLLYKEEITNNNNNVYIDILYPIANRVLPIIHVTRQDLYIKLFDIENENVYTIMTFNLEDIDSLAKLMMNNSKCFQSLKDSLSYYETDYIDNFKVIEVKYRYELSNQNFIYASGVRFQHSFTVKYNSPKNDYDNDVCELYTLFCYIELDKEDVNCYLDFNEAMLYWNERYCGKYNAVDNKIEPMTHKYYLSGSFSDIYLSRCLYKDQCYYIYNAPYGIAIVRADKSEYIELSPQQAALYRYKKYLIIYDTSKTLIIIDTEYNKIGCWKCEYPVSDFQIHYEQYYSKLRSKLIFLSKDLESLLIIDTDKLHLVFNNNKHSECIGNYGNNNNNKDASCDLLCYFNVKQLTVEAITRARGIKIHPEKVKLIRHYIDTNSDTLYILATYVIEPMEYVGLFSIRMSCNDSTFKKLYYVPINILHNGLAPKLYDRLGMSKIFLYRFDENASKGLDMAYDKNTRRLVDIRYNRNSIEVSTLRNILVQSNIRAGLLLVKQMTAIQV